MGAAHGAAIAKKNELSLPKCDQCSLPNCNGERHKSSLEYLYPVCTICGIELNELIDLYNEPPLRSQITCEVCSKIYCAGDDVNAHFSEHFRKGGTWSTQCIECNSVLLSLKSIKKEEDVASMSSVKQSNLSPIDPLADFTVEKSSKVQAICVGLKRAKQKAKDKRMKANEDQQKNHLKAEDDLKLVSDEKIPVYTRTKNSEGLYECQHCPETKRKSFKMIQNILRHERVVHRLPIEDDKKFACPLCPRRFKKRHQLQSHIRTHKEMVPDNCRVCKQPCENLFEKRKHERQTHFDKTVERWICPTCTKNLASLESLYRHVLQHDDNCKLPFICDQCGSSFSQKHHMATHMTTHSDERPYICDICPAHKNKSFSTIGGLRLHIKCFHQRKSSHACDKCDRVFTYNTDLRRHRRSHGGVEKKHACLVCDRRFYEPKDLRLHMEQHPV